MPHSKWQTEWRWLPRFVTGLLVFSASVAIAQSEFKAGVGREKLTPRKSIWLAGYAARKAPSDGVAQDLWVKALALEDETGARSVAVSADLLGLPAEVARKIAMLAKERLGIPRERLMLVSSHTHSGPVVAGNLMAAYDLNEEQLKIIDEYTATLPTRFVEAIERAIGDLEPCQLTWGIGTAGFAINRRTNSPNGPVDHDVPVLRVERQAGGLKAIAFGYACHNTTLDFQQVSGDYAGYAQEYLEKSHSGATALFLTGCGGDQNPNPRHTVELAKQHGEDLGRAVDAVLNSGMSIVSGPVRALYREIPLALSPPPTREEVKRQLEDPNVYVQRRAKPLMRTYEEKGALDSSYSYPLQVWQFADSLQMTALAGEVVVDYSLRLKRELGREKQWVIGYANDVMAYIPSLRVLKEGGYEGGEAMVYYGLYGPWAPTVEESIMGTLREMSRKE